MPTYADEAALEAYVAGTAYEARIPATTPERNRLLEDAERDVDRAIGPGPREDVGLLWTTATLGSLDPDQQSALSRATCAQAVYRVEMGPEHFVRAQREQVSGRSFSAQGKLPVTGPETWRELTYSGLLNLTTSTSDRPHVSDRDVGWHEV